VTSYSPGRLVAFYGRNGTFDPQIADIDFNTQDTVAVGELLTADTTVATNFTGPVAVITGEQDACFCYVNTTVLGACGQGDTSLPAGVQDLFPNASNFSYFIPEDVEHDVNLHYRAPIAYAYAHNWLEFNEF
jgi:hypothetical protein